ncbi:MAG: hypothetical protein IKO48_06500 [Elusimicrobia bacterium]|nr:hypothetical protein [Elusimicrobiota bacterium]
MEKEIGGYLGLELNSKYDNIGSSIALNSARNCLRYIIKAYKIKEICVPYYICPVVYQVIKKERCKINYYHIDNKFMPIAAFNRDAFVLYANYFGICAKNVKTLAKKYKNLIVDNAQAFYMPKCGFASFNSIRKFFGVADGALLYSDKKLNRQIKESVSYDKISHLLKRLDINATFGYTDFRKNSELLAKEPIKYISNLSKAIFNSIDIEQARKIRLKNFKYLHKQLFKTNKLTVKLEKNDVPMIYPYLVEKGQELRNKLIKEKIYVAQYWGTITDRSLNYNEKYILKNLVAIPIDQRYSLEDIKKIMDVIL